jgi:hypothetical protein
VPCTSGAAILARRLCLVAAEPPPPPQSLDQKPQRPPPPPATEVIRPHGKKMVITKGCGCEWCEAVSWELVGELRTDIEKLQQSLMLREVDRAELEALLQIKIEVTSDLREKLRRATEDAADLHKQIAAQQQRIADLELSVELHDTPEGESDPLIPCDRWGG